MYFSVNPADKLRLPLYKTVLCVTCALILIVNSFSLFHNLQSLNGANLQVERSARVSERVQYLNVLLMDAESSLRGYFLSGMDTYLGPSKTATAKVEGEFEDLQNLLSDNPSQLKNLAQLHTLMRRKMAIMQQAIEVYHQGGLRDIVTIAKASDGRLAMDEIRLLVVIMVQEQNETLAARSAAYYREYRKALMLGMGINGIAIAVLILFYRLVRRSFRRRAAVELELQAANETLESTVHQRTEQLSILSRHLINVSEEEKASLSRELHDEMGANLTAISMDLTAVRMCLLETEPALADQLQRAKATLLDAVELKRRIVEDLRPSLLDNLGLHAAIESYCEEFSRISSVCCATDIESDIDCSEPTLAIALFRIVQESLTNITKYAKASNVNVTLKREVGGLALRIIDDGVGIGHDTVAKPMSHGLLGMRERALLLGGTFLIRRGRNACGTCVEAFIPQPGAGGAALASQPPRRATDGHIPSAPPCNIRRRSVPGQAGQVS